MTQLMGMQSTPFSLNFPHFICPKFPEYLKFLQYYKFKKYCFIVFFQTLSLFIIYNLKFFQIYQKNLIILVHFILTISGYKPFHKVNIFLYF